MKIAIVDMTGEAGDVRLAAIAGAVQAQQSDYAYVWQSAPVPIRAVKDVSNIGGDETPCYILKDSDQADALGYHDTDDKGRPFARVFAGVILGNGGNWYDDGNSVSVCISHEVLETVGDPYANWWADSRHGFQRAIELCDFVESQWYSSGGIAVSNFMGPRYFSLASEGPYDYMGNVKHLDGNPAPGDYEIRRSPGGSSYPVFGEQYPEWKKILKAHPSSRTSKRLELSSLCSILGSMPEDSVTNLRKLGQYYLQHKAHRALKDDGT